MKPDSRFLRQDKDFWAHVRIISQSVGYTDKKTKQVHIPTLAAAKAWLEKIGMSIARIFDPQTEQLTSFGEALFAYFQYRASALNTSVEPHLMTLEQARTTFAELRSRLHPTCPLPMNKQKGDKKDVAFFTGIINMLIEANAAGFPVDYDPQALTSVTSPAKTPLRTLARRVDGAFPRVIDPIAVWEIKEYYYTTTFGSRVADGSMKHCWMAWNWKNCARLPVLISNTISWWMTTSLGGIVGARTCAVSWICSIWDMWTKCSSAQKLSNGFRLLWQSG